MVNNQLKNVTFNFDYTTHHTNRLLSVQTLDSENEILASYAYNYDAVGNATTITSLAGPTTYAYDNLYQLTSATRLNASGGALSSVSYGYDSVGNRTSVTQTGGNQSNGFDSGNELVSGPAGAYVYDKAGNMTSAGSVTYGWDALDRLTKISSTAIGPVTYVYDGDNHRVQKLSAGVTTNYFYDGNSEVMETDGNGNILKSFNPGIRVTDKQGNKLYYIYNGHGDVTALMDANENLVQSYNYDPYGTALGQTKDPNNFRYVGVAGVYSDDDAGLQYMQNRWYSPQLGRFISRDPSGFRGGLNLYDYCKNNPLNAVDSIGLCGSGLHVSADVGFFGINVNVGLFQVENSQFSLNPSLSVSFTPVILGGDFNFHQDTPTLIPNGLSVYTGLDGITPFGKYLGFGADSTGGNFAVGAAVPLPIPVGIAITIPPGDPADVSQPGNPGVPMFTESTPP